MMALAAKITLWGRLRRAYRPHVRIILNVLDPFGNQAVRLNGDILNLERW